MSSELCKTCVHAKVCYMDKNVLGDVFVLANPLFFDNQKRYEKFKEWEANGFPCENYMRSENEPDDFWKNEYIKEHDARIEEYKNSVPVVRCESCEYYIKHDKRCAVWNHGVFKDDYCSRGQTKKEVEE